MALRPDLFRAFGEHWPAPKSTKGERFVHGRTRKTRPAVDEVRSDGDGGTVNPLVRLRSFCHGRVEPTRFVSHGGMTGR